MNADTNSPIMPPLPANPDQMPIARPRSSGGKLEVMTDRVTGMIMAAPVPPRMRAAIIISGPFAKAATVFAVPKIASPPSRSGLRPKRSPMAPIGMSSAASAKV
uniref:Unannotated protein n=1 Tax=freshwater metagenome TaxID=449393 RepID=A0A6J7Q649_9ZZZZ